MAKKDLQISIMHGHSKDWKKVESIVGKLGYTPRVLIKEYEAKTIFDHLRDIIWDEIHGVIVILSRDDRISSNKFRARQNVVFELGYCFGAFDSQYEDEAYNAIIILKEKGVQMFSDIDGVKFIEFEKGRIENIETTLEDILKRLYKKAKKFYPKDF